MEYLEQIFNENMDNIKLISFCPICNAKYDSSAMKILEETNNGHLVHIQCKKCKSCVMAIIYIQNTGISSISIITDLNSSDVIKFKNKNPLHINDVIDLHNYLHSHKIIEMNKI